METFKKVLYISVGIIVIVSAFLIGYSFGTLEPNEYGLEYNANTLHLNKDKIWESGRYFIGLGHKFIKFPRTVNLLEFSGGSSIFSRTNDGLKIELDVSFNYRLMGDRLIRLYLDFGEDYEDVFKKIARNVVRDVAGDYSAFEYFSRREIIQSSMLSELSERFSDVHAYVDSYQLRNVKLPREFESAIERTLIAQLDIAQAQAELEQSLLRADTTRYQAQLQTQIVLNQANATASATVAQAKARASALIAKVDSEKSSYYDLRNSLNLTDVSEFLTYVWIQALQDTGAYKLALDLEIPPSLKNIYSP